MIKNVVAVVVTYNRKNLLSKNLEGLMNQTEKNLDIIVIDNGSTDGTKEQLREFIDKKLIKYIDTGCNLGGAGGFNLGIRTAFESGYEYIWIMDDDTVPKNNALENLLIADSLLKKNYGYLASNVLWKDNTLCLMNRQKYGYKTIVPSNYNSNLIRSTQASFVSLFIRRDVIAKVGLPIKDFFIWGDDIEFTRRISVINNFKSYMVKNSEVFHLMNVNIGSCIATDMEERLPRYLYAYRNECYTYRKAGIFGLIYFFLKVIKNILKILFLSDEQKSNRLLIIVNGVYKGLKFNPTIEYVNGKEGY